MRAECVHTNHLRVYQQQPVIASPNEPRKRPLSVQAAKEADACMDEYNSIIRGVVMEMKARGPPKADDMSVGAQLLRAKHPTTGKRPWSLLHQHAKGC